MDTLDQKIILATRHLYDVSVKPFVSETTKKQGQRLALVSVLAILFFSGTLKLGKSELLGFSFDIAQENILLLLIVLCLVFFYLALVHYLDLMDDKTAWRSTYSTAMVEQHALDNEIREEIRKCIARQDFIRNEVGISQIPEEFEGLTNALLRLGKQQEDYANLLDLVNKKRATKVRSRASVEYFPLLLAIIAFFVGWHRVWGMIF